MVTTEAELIALCLRIIGKRMPLSTQEQILARGSQGTLLGEQAALRIEEAVARGEDPLGDLLLELRSPTQRRRTGAIYTPSSVVLAMLRWLERNAEPQRVIDAGAGSGRYLMSAGRRMPNAKLIGIELDPLAALVLRANLVASGLHRRSQVLVDDYRRVALPAIRGVTAFVGNPPYVRHHDIGASWKDWYRRALVNAGTPGSALAGLHVHFLLKTLELAKAGDVGCFVTSAEWLDTNYGASLRQLVLNALGGSAIHVLAPELEVFQGTATTAAIGCFRLHKPQPAVRLRHVSAMENLGALSGGRAVARKTLEASPKWSVLVRPRRKSGIGDTELGELFRVHRGQVTGANAVWIAGKHSANLPEQVQFAAVTKARDLIEAGFRLGSASHLRRVIDIPADLQQFDGEERRQIDKFLHWARGAGADQSYIARHRKQWWSVGLRAPAPILCTYMARRPPQFTLNDCQARHINIAHGLYPREDLRPQQLRRLVEWLNGNVDVSDGRAYAGGLVKFEPKEMERILLPRELLAC